MLGLIDSLESAVRKLTRRPVGGVWSSYEQDPPYTPEAFERKGRLVAGMLGRVRPGTVWDLGANTGHFSRLAAGLGSSVAAFDADPDCIEAMYVEARDRGETRLLPLMLDLSNPSPASGWMNRERSSFFDRGRPDMVMALALVHHLAIAGNQPMSNVAELFRRLAPRLLIEFVPETDPQVRLLAAQRAGVHHPYDRETFERCFSQHFTIDASEPISERGRILYLLRRKGD
jgi:ribosomal protein L11 methylase PrmA